MSRSGERSALLSGQNGPTSSAASMTSSQSKPRMNEPFRSRSSSPTSRDEETSQARNRPHTSSPLLILLPSLLNAAAWALIEIPLVYLLRSRVCERMLDAEPGSLSFQDPQCRTQAIQTRMSVLRASFQTIAALLGIVMTSYYGGLSDQRGRKPIMVTCALFILAGDVWLWAMSVNARIGPQWVLLSAVCKGLGGYVSAIVAAQNSYVADCTRPENRSRFLGINFALYHFGTALGPITSGVLIERYGFLSQTLALAMSMWVFYFAYVVCILPESCPARETSAFAIETDSGSWPSRALTSVYSRAIEPLSMLLPRRHDDDGDEDQDTTWDIAETDGPGKRHLDALFCSIVIGLSLFASGAMNMLPLYTDYQLGWGPIKASALMSTDALCSALTLAFIFPHLNKGIQYLLKRYGGAHAIIHSIERAAWSSESDANQPPVTYFSGRPALDRRGTFASIGSRASNRDERITIVKRDQWVALLGYLVATLASIGFAVSRNVPQMLVTVALQSFSNAGVPAVQSLALNAVRPEYAGRLMSACATIEAFSLILRGPFFASVYSATLRVAPFAIFFVSAGVYMLCIVTLSLFRLFKPIGSE